MLGEVAVGNSNDSAYSYVFQPENLSIDDTIQLIQQQPSEVSFILTQPLIADSMPSDFTLVVNNKVESDESEMISKHDEGQPGGADDFCSEVLKRLDSMDRKLDVLIEAVDRKVLEGDK